MVDVAVAPLAALEVLVQPVRHEGAGDDLVEVDDPLLTGLRLGRPHRELAVHLAAAGARLAGAGIGGEDLLACDDAASLEVDVGPAQPECLAAAHAGGGEQLEERAEPVAGDQVEEPAELLGLPWLHLLARIGR